ncbi:MAG TPA: hypothetical protein VFC28_13305 [Opitutaceae bacterium]|nr:hypothetical protein [Opitutaceae bacterium]
MGSVFACRMSLTAPARAPGEDAILQACELDHPAHEFIHATIGGEVTRHALKL